MKTIEEQLGIIGGYQDNAYNSRNPFQSNWHRNKMFSVGSRITSKDKYVIDLGCGSGLFSFLYHQRFEKIWCYDHHSLAIEYLTSKCEILGINNVEAAVLEILDIESLKIDKKVDLILLLDVVEHVPANYVSKLIIKAKTFLNDNGRILITTPNYSSSWVFWEKFIDKFRLVPRLENAQHITKFDMPKLKNLIIDCGMTPSYATTINTFSFLIPVKRLSNLLLQKELHLKSDRGNLILLEATKL